MFALVDRLLDAGADLGEFINGAGDALRALLLTGVGGQPEGLTEGLQNVVREYAPQLPPADVVRLLTILGESEERLRRTGNTRLGVEVLLLRWAMLDRTVALGEVIDALKGSQEMGSGRQGAPPAPPGPAPVAPAASPTPESRLPSPSKGPLTLEHVRAVWPRIIADARARSPMLGSLLAETSLEAAENRIVTLRPSSAALGEGLDRQRNTISQLIGAYVDEPAPIRIKLVEPGTPGAGGGGSNPGGAPERPVRLNEERANAERLKVLRAKDPTLNAAVDALDLELLE